MSSKTADIVHIAVGVVSFLALIFNILGIYLLKASRIEDSVQINVIASLSLCDIVISIGTLLLTMLHFFRHPVETSKVAQVVWAFWAAVYHIWFTMFDLLTIDRFLGCNFPFKYRALATPKKIRFILGITWGLAGILGLTFSIFDTLKIRAFYNSYMWVTFDGIFLYLFFATYTTVFCRKKRINQNLSRQPSEPERRRFFALTAAMLTAFLVFEIIPTIGTASLKLVNAEIHGISQYIFELFWVINILVDPFIYIFFMPRVRRIVASKLRSLRGLCHRSRVDVSVRKNTKQSDAQTTSSTSKNGKICNEE